MITLEPYEAEVIVEFIEMNLIDAIKSDGIDSLQYLHTLLNVWRRCGGKYDVDDAKPWIEVKDPVGGTSYKCPDCGWYESDIDPECLKHLRYCPHCGKERGRADEQT